MEKITYMTKVKLVKLAEYEGALHPNNIEVGREEIGYMNEYPKVGELFLIFDGGRWFHTSTVQEIIDDNTFRTYNSIYQFTILQKIV